MKKIILSLAAVFSLALASCSDMLDVESDRFLDSPSLSSKTDSMFYAVGILEAMQHLADQYVLQNEMRGDLVTTTQWSSTHLAALANYSATAENKYDSAYRYYKVINNCNYYLAHRDTALYDGSVNVTLQEYAAVVAIRAWVYLQAARIYGKVKFFTEPMTTISQIEGNTAPELDIAGIFAQLEPQMVRFSGYAVPTYNSYQANFIPIDIVLGEYYLELGEWEKAARSYYTYIYNNETNITDTRASFRITTPGFAYNGVSLPADFSQPAAGNWSPSQGIISSINMPKRKTHGYISELPSMFGDNSYYATSTLDDSVYLEKIQIVPSAAYAELADTSDYYYNSSVNNAAGTVKSSFKGGDQRRPVRAHESVPREDSTYTYISNYGDGKVVLYRASTIWLHLAEALNRLGYPDAAFAILKDGFQTMTITSGNHWWDYIKNETKEYLSSTIPFFVKSGGTDETSVTYTYMTKSGASTTRNYGIHRIGCSDELGMDNIYSKYQLDTCATVALAGLQREFAENGFQLSGTKADTILAVEELLINEYAMENAFEGSRFSDLTRVARHRNADPQTYGANFGGIWFARKLARNNPVKDLTQEANWYLPFK